MNKNNLTIILTNTYDDDSDDDSDIVVEDSISEDDTENEDPTIKNTHIEILSPDNWEIYGDEDYTVQLLDDEDNPVIGAEINFKIETPEGTYTDQNGFTDEEGIAILPLDLSLRGIYTIFVYYYGDLEYNASESVNSSIILYEKTIIKTPKKYAYRSTDFYISLVTANGDALSNKKLIIYVDGVKYIKTTDSKGQVYIKMPSDRKSVNFNCSFEGGDYYLDSFLSMKLPVYKKTYTTPLVYAILKGKSFKILLKGTDGKILKKELVKFTINGKVYTGNVNNGTATIEIPNIEEIDNSINNFSTSKEENLIENSVAEGKETGLVANDKLKEESDLVANDKPEKEADGTLITLWTYNLGDPGDGKVLRAEKGPPLSSYTRLGIQGGFKALLSPFY